MKSYLLITSLLMSSNLLAMGDKPAEENAAKAKTEKTAPAEPVIADKDLPKLLSDKITPSYDPKLARSLLYKLKKDLPLTDAEQSHFEMVYEKAHVGEEELTQEDQEISLFANKVMDHKMRVAIEKRTQKYEMVGPDQPQNAPTAP